MEAAAAQAFFQGLPCLGWRFSGADVKFLAGAVDQAKVPEQKVAPKQAVRIHMTTEVEGFAVCRLISENCSTKFHCHHSGVGICDGAEIRILELNTKGFQRFQFSSDAAVDGRYSTSRVDHEIVTFSVDLAINHEVIAVIASERNRVVTQPFQVVFKRMAGPLFGCSSRASHEKNRQPQATLREEFQTAKLR